MAERPHPLEQPRLLSRERAASYCGLSPNQFTEEVDAGTFPGPVPLKRTRRTLWDRIALDRALDARLTVDLSEGTWDERERKWRQNRQAAAR